MKLVEALNIAKGSADAHKAAYRAYLACGFQPLHLATFLTAHLQLALADRKAEVLTGVYGDLPGNIMRAASNQCDCAVIVMEWADLDPRLGIRQLGIWNVTAEGDILGESGARLHQIEQAIHSLAGHARAVCCLPTLELPPFVHTPCSLTSEAEMGLREALDSFASRVARSAQILNMRELDRVSPLASRHDVEKELTSGIPYQLAHADHLAALLSKLMVPPTPKKGIITDLDDTLWSGILGEVGPEGVHWDLDHHSQIHGLYQQLLRSLAESGVLVGVASRNDPGLVEQTLRQSNLLVPRDHFYPVEASWQRKSESVARIIQAWNIGPDSVVFVDDSPMELAEVKAAFPDIGCILFSASDVNAAYGVLFQLRELFGKPRILEEDLIRAQSLRQAKQIAGSVREGITPASEEFLSEAQAEVTVIRAQRPVDPRAVELVNKTNQFNLNGKRYDETAWNRHISSPGAVYALISYRDKFGPLGKIGVLAGHLDEKRVSVDTWVMSCRAFGRNIEHASLKYLFDTFAVSEIAFDFVPTNRNGPIRELLEFYVGALPNGSVAISRELFSAKCPKLFHRIVEPRNE
jgi:FkbH-like protein